jgi:hypothetical protein
MATYRVVWEKLGRGTPPVAQTFEGVDDPDELAFQVWQEITTARALASRNFEVAVDLDAMTVVVSAGVRQVGWATVTELVESDE